MARVAENRTPALPITEGQKERYRRILRAAAAHGATHGLEHTQMTDVAKDAGVAIGTLYRYFPSKSFLFTALMRSQVEGLSRIALDLPPGSSPADAVARLLTEANRRLLRRPLLVHAMLHSNNAMVAGDLPAFALTDVFADLIMEVAGVRDASPYDRRLVRLVEQTWYGILTSQLTGHISEEEGEIDTIVACRLLLADLGASDQPSTEEQAAV